MCQGTEKAALFWGSLEIQWLRLYAFPVPVQYLMRELRSHKLHGIVKKKIKEGRSEQPVLEEAARAARESIPFLGGCFMAHELRGLASLLSVGESVHVCISLSFPPARLLARDFTAPSVWQE